MFSTLSPAFSFDTDHRPQLPLSQIRKVSSIKPKGPQESSLVANLNLALSGLNPNHATVIGPSPPPTLSFSTLSKKTTRSALSSKAMSLGRSTRSHGSPLSELPTKHETMTSKSSSRASKAKLKSRSKTKFPFTIPPEGSLPPLPSHPAIHIHDTDPHIPRPSFESISSSHSGRSHRVKERKVPINIPPPLQLEKSNLHEDTDKLSVIDVVAPPRVESNLSKPPQAPTTPSSPNFQPPSEEEQRRLRLGKLMRTLGEEIPAELVYRGSVKRTMNVNVFPDPPIQTEDNALTRRQKKEHMKLNRHGSFNLLTNLSSVTATLLPSGLGKNRSRDLSDPDEPRTSEASSRPSVESSDAILYIDRPARMRPESTLLSPITFASRRPMSQLFPFPIDRKFKYDDNDSPPGNTRQQKDATKASKLARRASLHTATFLPPTPTSGMHLRSPSFHAPYRNHPGASETPVSPYNPSSLNLSEFKYNGSPHNSISDLMEISPMSFSIPLPPETKKTQPFHLVVDDHDGDFEDEPETESRTSLSLTRHSSTQSTDPQGRLSEVHLPIHPRPDTPFLNSGVPVENLLTPGMTPLTGADGRDAVVRKERRQGWSGEWNRGDMQDVIQKLRTLK